MKVVCNCGGEMKNLSSDAKWINSIAPGQEGREYQIWNADLMECPTCSNTCLRLALRPCCEKHEENFKKELELARASEYCFEE